MKSTPENAVKAEVRGYLKLTGWFVFPVLQGLGAYRGISDMIAIKNGLVLFIECKSKRGKLNGEQMKFKEDLKWNGGHYIVARGYEEVKEYVEGQVKMEVK
jgi:Holliday junction resolvase